MNQLFSFINYYYKSDKEFKIAPYIYLVIVLIILYSGSLSLLLWARYRKISSIQNTFLSLVLISVLFTFIHTTSHII